MTGSSFIERLMSRPHVPDAAFPGFRRIGPPEPSSEPKILRPTYSYDLAELDQVRDGKLAAMDDLMAEKRKQLMDQLIPGVCYETGTTTENHSTFIWARPVRVHPDWAPHVMAWGRCLTGLVNQP